MTQSRILILGGTGEARRLAEALSERYASGQYKIITSLAGRTQDPVPVAGIVRQGGFGGLAGFLAYLDAQSPVAVIDATHPYAARMGTTAAEATVQRQIPFLRLDRPAWTQQSGDDWHVFQTVEALADALPNLGRHGLITLGGANLAAFSQSKGMRLTLRAIDPPGSLPDHPAIDVVLARGPFDFDSERSMLIERGIDVIATRNAGGAATRAKIDAARALKIPVALLARPARPDSNRVESVAAALQWIDDLGLWF
ncbi:MAG: cobalt-precorrin-6A reductase [Alphaproteobacteria bacterium]|nr:cobalt-precorrin-6A reductase [Alphaproteobacteria bacterium]